MKLIFFGAGYCSKFIMPKLNSGFEIICTHKENIKSEKFDNELNIHRLTLNDFEKNKEFYFSGATHIINSIPPENDQDLVYNLLKSLNINLVSLKWFGYLSSTSVYGNHNGDWVDEDTEVKPLTKRGKKRRRVEEIFLNMYQRQNFPSHIFRLPGIYGPGRSAIDKLNNGKKLVIKKKSQFFSRVHVEDIAQAIILSMKNITPGEIFNVTDNFPSSSEEVTLFAAKILKIKKLEYINIDSDRIGSVIKDFYSDNKKVSNKKIKKILGWTPKFENYKLGLKDIFKKSFNG